MSSVLNMPRRVRRRLLPIAAALACLVVGALFAQDEPIDWDKARELHQRVVQGETLTPEEQAYYDRAAAALRQGRPGKGQPAAPAPWTQHLTPVTELGAGTYKGEDGGLYGAGSNRPPPPHAAAALAEAAKIRPLDANGAASPSGKIVLLSVGMSNTTMEFSHFKSEADRDPAKSGAVVLVDGAQGGQTAMVWANPNANVWAVVDSRLRSAGATPTKVQAVWIKQAESNPSRLGEFPAHAKILEEHLVTVLNLLQHRFPNLRIAYLSSRIYAGYATTPLNPEPYAYESAFAVRWLIQGQIADRPELNHDPARGPVKSPLLLWGPYLWADGATPRRSDGLTWQRQDFAESDGTHPSEPSGREKVAGLLLKFFKTDPTAQSWFVKAESGIASSSENGGAANEAPIDVALGRALMRKWQRGEPLTPEENAYLDLVRQEIQRRSAQRQSGQARAATAPRALADWSSLVPLTDLTGTYKGQDGGLYGGGSNVPPPAHRAAWLGECAKIQPLDAGGRPARDGKIVLLTLGFSNTHLESEDFVKVGSADPQKSPGVVLVDGAIGGRAAVMWAYDGDDVLSLAERERLDREMDVLRMPKSGRGHRAVPQDKDTWPTLDLQLKEAGVTPLQVQAVWMKHVEAGASALGEFPAHAKALEADLADILDIAKQHFPNLRVALLSSRTYGGWANPTSGSPEPYAYESGFAVRWLLQHQIQGDPLLNYDFARGAVKAPIAVCGPYLWACGDKPRKVDGLAWTEQDVRSNDHLHPSAAGYRKVTILLLNFLKSDPGTRLWFAKPGT